MQPSRQLRQMAIALVGLLAIVTACAPAPAGSGGTSTAPQRSAPTSRTLIAAVRNEPSTLAAVPLGAQGLGIAQYFTKRMFNADPAILDDEGIPQPYLADALPQLDTDSWQVNPDGTMVTTWQLRPNLTWHDGSPLTTDDFVFSWQVYGTPAFGHANLAPFSLIDDVSAPDPLTLVIRWKQLYAQADSLQSIGTGAVGLPPLPRALLES